MNLPILIIIKLHEFEKFTAVICFLSDLEETFLRTIYRKLFFLEMCSFYSKLLNSKWIWPCENAWFMMCVTYSAWYIHLYDINKYILTDIIFFYNG